jgi:hypothetical protein
MITESRNQPGKKVRWTGGHPERRNAMIKWTDSDWGNHLADRVAAGEHPPEIKEVETIPLSSYVEKLQSSYNHWHIRKHGSAFLGSITLLQQPCPFSTTNKGTQPGSNQVNQPNGSSTRQLYLKRRGRLVA